MVGTSRRHPRPTRRSRDTGASRMEVDRTIAVVSDGPAGLPLHQPENRFSQSHVGSVPRDGCCWLDGHTSRSRPSTSGSDMRRSDGVHAAGGSRYERVWQMKNMMRTPRTTRTRHHGPPTNKTPQMTNLTRNCSRSTSSSARNSRYKSHKERQGRIKSHDSQGIGSKKAGTQREVYTKRTRALEESNGQRWKTTEEPTAQHNPN